MNVCNVIVPAQNAQVQIRINALIVPLDIIYLGMNVLENVHLGNTRMRALTHVMIVIAIVRNVIILIKIIVLPVMMVTT